MTLSELRDVWIDTRLLGSMDNKRLRAYARALDLLIERYGHYCTDWLTVNDFVQMIEEAIASSNNYPLRRMGAMRCFFAFLHDLGLLTYEELATLQNASYDRQQRRVIVCVCTDMRRKPPKGAKYVEEPDGCSTSMQALDKNPETKMVEVMIV